MKLKILALITIIICFAQVIWLVSSGTSASIFEDPLSTMGNIGKNYPFFIISTITTAVLFTIILFGLYMKKNIDAGFEIILIPVLGLITAITPYDRERMFFRIVHTAAAVLGALFITYAIYRYNKKYDVRNLFDKFLKKTHIIAFIGTLTLFFLTGLNVVMQIFFFTIVSLWMTRTTSIKNE